MGAGGGVYLELHGNDSISYYRLPTVLLTPLFPTPPNYTPTTSHECINERIKMRQRDKLDILGKSYTPADIVTDVINTATVSGSVYKPLRLMEQSFRWQVRGVTDE